MTGLHGWAQVSRHRVIAAVPAHMFNQISEDICGRNHCAGRGTAKAARLVRLSHWAVNRRAPSIVSRSRSSCRRPLMMCDREFGEQPLRIVDSVKFWIRPSSAHPRFHGRANPIARPSAEPRRLPFGLPIPVRSNIRIWGSPPTGVTGPFGCALHAATISLLGNPASSTVCGKPQVCSHR